MTPKDRSLQGTQEQLEGMEQYQEDKVKQGAGAGERDEQPGGYGVSKSKSDQAAQQRRGKIRSLKDAVEDEKQRNAEEDVTVILCRLIF
ncbi:MAG TPA: hypothetical protein VK738_16385 [Terriglobales bacterium]|jgi:hypothetical protein|nr:hypothetical protein [Terriglobales bacterium]